MNMVIISLMILSGTSAFARQEAGALMENHWDRKLAAEQVKAPEAVKESTAQPTSTQQENCNKPKCC